MVSNCFKNENKGLKFQKILVLITWNDQFCND